MINLLPPGEKKQIADETNARIIFVLGIGFMIFLLVLFLSALFINVKLNGSLQADRILLNAAKEDFKKSGNVEVQKKLEADNQKIYQISTFYEGQSSLVSALELISDALPGGIYLTNLSYREDSGSFQISGFSPTRDNLYNLKNNLEKATAFKDVVFPPSDWLKPMDIDFQVNFKLSK